MVLLIGLIAGLADVAESKDSVSNDDGTIVAVCRDPNDLKALESRLSESTATVRVASENLSVRETASAAEWVDEVSFIETPESYFEVEDAVSAAVDEVNDWLRSIENSVSDLPAGTLFWRKEGVEGVYAYAIQDAVLLIRSYRTLLDDVDTVIIRRRKRHEREDDLLASVAATMDVTVKPRPTLGFRCSRVIPVDPTTISIPGINTDVIVPSWVWVLKQRAQMITRIIRAKRAHVTPKTTTDRLVAFQLGGSSQKHVDNVVGPMDELDDRERYGSIGLCWGAHDGARALRNNSFDAIELEALFPLQELPMAFRTAHATRSKGLRTVSDLEGRESLVYRGVDISSYVSADVKQFLCVRPLTRQVLHRTLTRYFESNRPNAIKVWCAGSDEYGLLTRQTVTKHHRPLLFHYFVGEFGNLGYFQDNVDHYFVSGERDGSKLERHGVDSDRITVTGKSRYEGLNTFSETHCAVDSRATLDLSPDVEFWVFYAPQGTTRGALSRQEKVIVMRTLIAFAADNPDAGVIVKPHPSDSSGLVEHLVETCGTPSVELISRDKLPDHCINVADVVVTKYSSVGFEAMLMKRPLVAVALDGESRFDNFGDVPERAHDAEALTGLLEGMLDRYDEYVSKQRERREGFLAVKFEQETESPTAMLVDEIVRQLEADR